MTTLAWGTLVLLPFFLWVYLKSYTGLGLRAALFILIPFHSLSLILTLHCADGGVGNSSSLSYAPSSAHVISSYSSKHSISSHEFLHPNKITSTEHLVCFSLLVTTFLFPFSLHMPLITTFSFSFSLHMPLITTFSFSFSLHMPLVTTFSFSMMGLGWFGRRNLLEKFFIILYLVCDSGIRITWVQVSRLPVLHPDRD